MTDLNEDHVELCRWGITPKIMEKVKTFEGLQKFALQEGICYDRLNKYRRDIGINLRNRKYKKAEKKELDDV